MAAPIVLFLPFSVGQSGEDLLAIHPTVKPLGLVADAILDCSAPGELILDPFLGSGTTLLAAQRTRRVCFGIEMDPAYVDTAIRRWEKMTGKSAVHAASGEIFGHREINRLEELEGYDVASIG